MTFSNGARRAFWTNITSREDLAADAERICLNHGWDYGAMVNLWTWRLGFIGDTGPTDPAEAPLD